MKNPMETLLGKTFPMQKSNGNYIEYLLGGKNNSSSEPDLGTWEVKSHDIDSRSFVTLGGKKTDSMTDLIDQVYNKIKNTIFVEYKINRNNTFTVISVHILYDLEKSIFVEEINKTIKIEYRSDGQTTLKISRRNFLRLYKNRLIEYQTVFPAYDYTNTRGCV